MEDTGEEKLSRRLLMAGALAGLLIALIAVHVAAALKHHFIARDTTLKRMISTAPAKADS